MKRTKNILVAAFVVMILSSAAFLVGIDNFKAAGESSDTDIVINLGGVGSDQFNDAIHINGGGYVAVGYSASASFSGSGDWVDAGITGKGNEDAIIVKFDSDGTVIWKTNFGGAGVDRFESVIESDNGYIAVGYSDETSFSGSGDWVDAGITGKDLNDAIIVKFDSDGAIVWKNNFGGAGMDRFESVIESDNGYVAVGYSASASFSGSGDWVDAGITGKGNDDAIIVKFNADGSLGWRSNFGGAGLDRFESIVESDNGYLVAGHSATASFSGSGDWVDAGIKGKGGYDAAIVKFDHNGDLQWMSNFGGSGLDLLMSVIRTGDGYIAVGYSASASFSGSGDWVDAGITGKGSEDAIIVKFDTDGAIVWKNNFGGAGVDRFESVIESDNGYVAVGYSAGISFSGSGDWVDAGITGKGNDDVIIVNFNAEGDLGWRSNFGGSENERSYRVLMADGRCIIVGHSKSSETGDMVNNISKGNEDAIISKFRLFDVIVNGNAEPNMSKVRSSESRSVIILTPGEGVELPETIGVTMGGSLFGGFTYDPATGMVVITGPVTGDIVIAINMTFSMIVTGENNEPLSDAQISVNGIITGTTDASGELEVTLGYGQVITVEVVREDHITFRGTYTVDGDDIHIEMEAKAHPSGDTGLDEISWILLLISLVITAELCIARYVVYRRRSEEDQ